MLVTGLTVMCNIIVQLKYIYVCIEDTTGNCLKPEQFLKAEHLLKHAFRYRDRFFYGPDR